MKTASIRAEQFALSALIVLLNLPLIHGACATAFIFFPDRVMAGEWWRMLTHPFVHVSFYHLLLDATAFLVLYEGLAETRGALRMACLAACGAGSLLVSWIGAPLIQRRGLCGLSGIAHGLMAVGAIEMLRPENDRILRRAGAVSFIIVVSKSMLEAATGELAFDFVHFGPLGTPIYLCHAGGVLGGLIFCLAVRMSAGFRSRQSDLYFFQKKPCDHKL